MLQLWFALNLHCRHAADLLQKQWQCDFLSVHSAAQLAAESNFAPKMKLFPKQVLKRFSTYIAVIVIFIYNVVLDRSLECTCEEQTTDCIVYMTLPFFIIFVLQLWTEKTFQRVLNYTCSDRCNLLCILFYHILKAAFVGLLWIVSVLIDGDWYVCCLNNGSENQAQLACKNKSDITPEERKIINKLKNYSLVIGLSLLLCALSFTASVSSFRWLKCCYHSSCCNRKKLYYKVILKEEEHVLKDILIGKAKEQLTEKIMEKIRTPNWDDCFDAAVELIKEETSPGRPEAAEQFVKSHLRPSGSKPSTVSSAYNWI
ncbi:uncharacterized protein LOC115584980 isoform X2 [Sparus aurata]|uniref:uncharacterized protein LOC115584980 isoform X2 n=1 Tax=Sparus aurata TaxID=8175 RepID=UPI0011C0F8C3|nr:uncharacterized protein LOC115584980 isoform X2 [Sparus aurata]